MFRCHPQLAADMVFTKFLQKSIICICHYIIKTDPRSDKYLFDSRQFFQFPQQCHIITVVCFYIGADLRKQTLLILAHPFGHLLFAGRSTKVAGRTAYIMNVSFKIRFFRDLFCLPQNGLMAPHLHDPSLMKSQGAETAAAVTSPAAGKAKLDLLNSRYSSQFFITWMISSYIRIIINIIHLLSRQRHRRWILHHRHFVWIHLNQRFCRKRIRIFILLHETLCVLFLTFADFFIRRKPDRFVTGHLLHPALVHRSRYKYNVFHRQSAVQRLCHC